MSNPLMQSMGMTSASSPNVHNINNIISMLRSGNPQRIAQTLMQKNPQFKAFMDANHGKTPEQVAKEHGLDINSLMKQI